MAPELDDETLAFAHRMFDLARYGGAEELSEQLDAGLPVNLTNSQGDTLLILGAYHKQQEVVRALVDRGADLDRANDRGQTALAAAVFRQDAELVSLLLRAGADPAAGAPSAIETATFFELPEMHALLQQ